MTMVCQKKHCLREINFFAFLAKKKQDLKKWCMSTIIGFGDSTNNLLFVCVCVCMSIYLGVCTLIRIGLSLYKLCRL